MAGARPGIGVGGVIWRGPEQLLLVRRRHPPLAGEWSIPGGRVEPGERLHDALLREIREETGVGVRIAGLIDVAEFIETDRCGAPAAHFVLIDFTAEWTEGEARAGSDASDCGWFTPNDAVVRVGWEETRRIIRASAKQMWNLVL